MAPLQQLKKKLYVGVMVTNVSQKQRALGANFTHTKIQHFLHQGPIYMPKYLNYIL